MMHGPNGDDYDNKITYIEIVSPERIVYSHGDDKEDEKFRLTVTFDEQHVSAERCRSRQRDAKR
jgi:uncharacterized protein YndB with AHSA1/START domain